MPLATTTEPSTADLHARPWPDDVLDSLGHDPRSSYAERFWLPVLGPSSLLLLRRLAAELEANPEGTRLAIEPMARSLGLAGKASRNSPILRTIGRCCQFRLLYLDPHDGELLVRRKLPPLTRSQLNRLPHHLQHEHQRWQDQHVGAPTDDDLFDRARHLALSLFQLGEALEDVELHLRRLRFHPTIASRATGWAWRRNREDRLAAQDPDGPADEAEPGPQAGSDLEATTGGSRPDESSIEQAGADGGAEVAPSPTAALAACRAAHPSLARSVTPPAA